ncbi:MAG TPA: L-threonylcarbamoyladenylate synthase [Chitinophagaceae bacterium]|nr:L-threonylcarbamoyladenylate synthase [Chitinophagaceae bacterium]
MTNSLFEQELNASLEILRRGGLIVYPTDTIWGIGCDATNKDAVARIFQLKKREDTKSMIVLVAEERDVLYYTASPDLSVFNFIQEQDRPTTVIYEHALHLPDNLTAADGSIAMRIVRDEFCRHLIKRLKKPIVSTSANISGAPAPQHFNEISDEILSGVDHVVKWRQQDTTKAMPSQIIRWENGAPILIRK